MSFSPIFPWLSQPRIRQARLCSYPHNAKVADKKKTFEHELEEQHAYQRAYLKTARAPSAPTTPPLDMSRCRRRRRRKSRQLPHTNTNTTTTLLAIVAVISILPTIAAQTTCIPLTGSSACPAFSSASIATTPYLLGLFPFLNIVTDLSSFDTALQDYVTQGYVQSHYISLFGCSAIDLTNTTAVYARYTTSFLCNAIIQNSIEPCGLSTANSQPLCADSCANFALSEQTIVSTPSICGTNPAPYAISQLRADFTNCALPANAITGTCIPAYLNEPNNCGFQNNLEGLCAYCGGSTVNSTDSCCLESRVETRCQGVRLPAFTNLGQLFTTTVSGAGTTVTATPTGASGSNLANGRKMLSAGQIAGIVVGSVLGGLLLLALLVCGGLLIRRRRKEQDEKDMMYGRRGAPPAGNIPPPMTHTYQAGMPPTQAKAGPPGGGRVVGMAALQHGNDSPRTGTTPSTRNQSTPDSFAAAGVASIPRRRDHLHPQQRIDGSSPSPTLGGPGNIAGGAGHQQSPEGSQESEQMESFKDYYSSQDIHVGDLVSVLWAYQPRADDELPLERGEMLRIVGIWDDGWATAVRVEGNAETWEPSMNPGARDSVVGGFGGQGVEGQVKAVPLVCVCLPHYWRKAIEGDSSADEPRTSEEADQPRQHARESTYDDYDIEDYDDGGAAVGTALGEPSEPRRRGGAQMGVHPALRPSELP